MAYGTERSRTSTRRGFCLAVGAVQRYSDRPGERILRKSVLERRSGEEPLGGRYRSSAGAPEWIGCQVLY